MRHGLSKKFKSEYSSWNCMRTRCMNKKYRRFDLYGGRGIIVCERWKSFENFLEDMGKKPSKYHSIDRIDRNGNYEPGNCRWATQKEQCSHLSKNVILEIDGVKNTVSEWSRISGLSQVTISRRISKGFSPKDAVFIPPKNDRYESFDLKFNGETKSLRAWSIISKIARSTLKLRIFKMKWTVEKALTTPNRKGLCVTS